MKKLIVVADWAGDDLACQEFRTAVTGHLLDLSIAPEISFIRVKQSTVNAGFNVAQIAETELRHGHPAETVIFVMCDNHIHEPEHHELPEGEPFFIARLQSGLYVCGPNAGYSFTFIKPATDRLFTYHIEGEEQYDNRARDVYSKIIALMMEAQEDTMDIEEVHTNLVPELADHVVLDVNTFGNVRISYTKEDVKGKAEYGEELRIEINGESKQVKYVEKLFGDHEGVLIVCPGTIGTPDNPYLEIGIWNGNASAAFGNPMIGSIVKLG